MLAVVPFTMLTYAKLLQVQAPVISVVRRSAVGLSEVLAVYFLETDAQVGVFSMSMAIGSRTAWGYVASGGGAVRYGDQEFCVLLHDWSAEEAGRCAQ